MDEQQPYVPPTPPPPYEAQPSGEAPYQQPPYGQVPPYGQPQYDQPQYGQPPAQGLSENAASALAYVTIIPAIVFLVMEPYNRNPRIKFHAFQCLGLAAAMMCISLIAIIPILGWIVFIVGWISLVVIWIICVVNASQGKVFKVPLVGNFAAQQSGFMV